MKSCRTVAALFLGLLIVLLQIRAHSQTRDVGHETAHGAVAIQEAHGLSGITRVRPTSVRVVQVADIPQLHPGMTSQAASASTQNSSADNASSLVLQTFQGPVQTDPPDPAIAVGPDHVIATVNSTMTIYDKKGAVLSSMPIAAFMSRSSAAVWDTHLYYDAVSGHFFVVCATGDQRTTGSILLAVSATSDARGTWYVYDLNEIQTGWLDFPSATMTTNSLVLSFQDIPAEGSTQKGICATEVIGLPELVSGNQNLKITRFNTVFGPPGQCNYAYPVINDDPSTVAYLLSPNLAGTSGNSLAFARIDTSATPALDVSSIAVPQYSFPQPVPQKGSSTRIIPGSIAIDGTAIRNGSLWCTHTIAASNGSAVVRWYQIDPDTRKVIQLGEIAGLGDAWMGALAVLPDNEVDVVYTTSSANNYASAGYAHRSAADPPNTMPITGVYQAGSSAYSGTRWGDFFQAEADPDGQSAWGIAEYMGASTYGTAIVQLAASSAASVTPQLTLAVAPTSAVVNAGVSAKFTVSVADQNAGVVSFSCSGLPSGATCSFNPSTVNGSGTVELTITTARTSGVLTPASSFATGMFTGLLAIALLPGLRRRTRFLGLLLVICALVAFVSCGGVGSSAKAPTGPTTTPTPPPTPPPPSPTPPVTPPTTSQSFAVTVTAQAATIKTSATITLTVQ